MAQGLVERISREALAKAIEKIKEEAEASVKHPSGIFPFVDLEEKKGIFPFFGTSPDESFNVLGWEVSNGGWTPPKDTQFLRLHADWMEIKYYYLYKAGYEKQSPEYILLFDNGLLRVVEFDEIEPKHQMEIQKKLEEWALLSIQQGLENITYEEHEGE